MTCQNVQNKILALADPRYIPDPLREHVAGCALCQAWAKQAARARRIARTAPRPARAGRQEGRVREQFDPRRGDHYAAARPSRRAREFQPFEFLRRNATLVGGLAAAVLVALGVWAMFPRSSPRPEMASLPDDPFLKKMVERDLALAKADTPANRLRVLGGLADDLSVQARSLARVASPDELRDLARWYDRVVKDAILKQAETMHGATLTPADAKARAETLDAVTKRLGATAAETDKLLNSVPPEAKPALQKIADAARDGQKTIELVELRGKDKN